jgi:hypothetical protein
MLFQIINGVIIIVYSYSPYLEEIVRYLTQIFFFILLEILTIVLSYLDIISWVLKIFIMIFFLFTSLFRNYCLDI